MGTEVAKSGKSKCQKCKELIPKGNTRIGKPYEFKGKPSTKWYHQECYNSNNKAEVNDNKNQNKCENERLLGKIIPPKGWSSVMSKCIKCYKKGILPFVDICSNCGRNKHPDQEIHTWFLESTKIKSQKSNSKPI